jgi:hypothetical protein
MRPHPSFPAVAWVILTAIVLAGCADGRNGGRLDTALATTSTVPATPIETTTTSTTSTTTTTVATTINAPPAESTEMVAYVNTDHGFQILRPTSWDVFENVADVAVVFAAPGYPDAMSVHVYVDQQRDDWTLQEWVSVRYAEIERILGASGPHEWVGEETPTSLGTNDAWAVAYAAVLHPDEIPVFFTEVLAVADGRGFIVTFANPNALPAFPAFGAMLTSFELLPPG